jgi:CheY-like chemotaxis protein
MTIRVLLADDQMVRMGCHDLWRRTRPMWRRRRCHCRDPELRPDVSLLDIRMPRLDGLRVAKLAVRS